VKVLSYAVKHGYADLADEAAYGSLGCKADEIAKSLTMEKLNAWVCLLLPIRIRNEPDGYEHVAFV
jgi:hypothetical protein